jgi:carboxylesterase
MGLSMGGTVVLRLAELHPDEVAGVVTVNASLATARKDAKLLPLISKVLATFPGIGSDIKKPGVVEQAYPKIALKAAYSLQKAWPVVRADLPKISCPVLAFRSAQDHVVEPISGEALRAGCVHAEERVLHDSYHVATLDNDAPEIFEGSLAFVRQHAPAAAG